MKRKTSYPIAWSRDVVKKFVENHARGARIASRVYCMQFGRFCQFLEQYCSYDQLKWRIIKKVCVLLEENCFLGDSWEKANGIAGEVLNKCRAYVEVQGLSGEALFHEIDSIALDSKNFRDTL